MAPKIQTRTEIRYKCAQCFLGITNLKKSAAIITAIFWSLTHMRKLLEGEPRKLGTSLLSEKEERSNVFPCDPREQHFYNDITTPHPPPSRRVLKGGGDKIKVGLRPQLEAGLSSPIRSLKERAGSLKGGVSGPLA